MARVNSLPNSSKHSSLPSDKDQEYDCDHCGEEIKPWATHYRQERGGGRDPFYIHPKCYRDILREENMKREKIDYERKQVERRRGEAERRFKNKWG